MLITEPSLNPKSALQKGLRLAGYNLLTLVFLSLVVEGCIRLANPDILPLATDSVFLTDSLFGASLHDASDFYLYGDGIHFSMEGHRVVSEIVTELD